MKILLEAHHPAHVHFWKYPVRELQKRGHEVLMIGRDRDVMRRLLEVYDWIPCEIPPRSSKKNRFPMHEMLQRQWVVAKAIRRFKPDVVASLMGSYTQSAKLFGVRSVIFTDTETQAFNHIIAHPFADEIHTPKCFLKDFGRKHQRYQGLHELAYLAPDCYSFDASMLSKYQVKAEIPYIVLRLSAWNTFHDRDRLGIGEAIFKFVDHAKVRYRIILSAEESKVPPGLEEYATYFEPEDFHHLLAGASFVLTEGATTASEAACLGVPSVFINSVGHLGNYKLLDEHYKLIRTHSGPDSGIPDALACIDSLEMDRPRFLDSYRTFIEEQEDV
ncbi:MAG: DUF354 domain-containing protein, partial [Opitutales bacterium]